MAFGVYIHFPYCAQRCPYCDFAIAVRKTIRHERYLDAILAELSAKAPLFAQRQAVSVYFGGGTPSLWRPECIKAALDAALHSFPPPQGVTAEVTLECDPAELLPQTLDALRRAGINRLSIGAQSFSRRHLQVLGRRHEPAQIQSLCAAARQAGFDNLSLDLMIGLIGQRPSELRADLADLVALFPEHVSLYQLTVEPRTPLGAAVRRGSVSAPNAEDQADAYETVRAVLAQAGYVHYEISSFARARDAEDLARNLRSRHNSLYWTGGEYLGLGMGAHSFRRSLSQDFAAAIGERFANQRGIDAYLGLWAPGRTATLAAETSNAAEAPFSLLEGAPGLALYERRTAPALLREAVWLGLRRIDGICCLRFAAEYGVDPRQEYASTVQAMVARGWLEIDKDTLRLTNAGLLFADEVGAAFL